ncbi:hypothetical protein Rleg2_4228 [Rhizobium leguminosarum bv. trifolii WSM2304]|uniref:RloB domain-containing protein n=1 Tax=Rhizobium leguminosarum bv. trifolii (strain WSM2304) TaxID=395492 RepID=A0ABF7QTT4_RHILW|nr:hypothetical protein Rleg2_4228 [Rhizobium leguminosarum bv. trifolii WSM2304]
MRQPRAHPRQRAHQPQRVQRRRVFVGCEGESERAYASLVSRLLEDVHHRVHLDTTVLGGGDPLALCQAAERAIKRGETNREAFALKFLLLDRDKIGLAPQRDQGIQPILNGTGAVIIWQDTAHEAMLLRHLPGCAALRPPSTALAVQQLVQRWPQYEKPMNATQLGARLDLARLQQAAAVEPDLANFFAQIEFF